jgi:hypothetical protein
MMFLFLYVLSAPAPAPVNWIAGNIGICGLLKRIYVALQLGEKRIA